MMVTKLDDRRVVVESGTSLDFFGSTFHFRLTGADTGGAYSLVEYDAPPGAEGPPAHIHEGTEEYIFVLEGNLDIVLGDRHTLAGPGDGVLVPRGALHTFYNSSSEPVRFLTLLKPGGFEGLLAEAAMLAAAGQWPPSPETGAEVFSRYDMVVPQD
jgi:uncharacterized cupin superfamily protein